MGDAGSAPAGDHRWVHDPRRRLCGCGPRDARSGNLRADHLCRPPLPLKNPRRGGGAGDARKGPGMTHNETLGALTRFLPSGSHLPVRLRGPGGESGPNGDLGFCVVLPDDTPESLYRDMSIHGRLRDLRAAVDGARLSRSVFNARAARVVASLPATTITPLGRRTLKTLARPEGLEPPAYWFEASRSIRLSYGRPAVSHSVAASGAGPLCYHKISSSGCHAHRRSASGPRARRAEKHP